MKIKLEVEATVEEVERSTVLRELFERLHAGTAATSTDAEAEDPEEEAADEEDEDVETPAPVGSPSGTDDVPGVDPAGQAVVKARLRKNPAADLFRSFLDTVNSWPNADVSAITPKGKSAGAPADYSQYLKVNKLGSPYGAFVYAWPNNGRIDLRLSYPSDDALHEVAPAAYRYLKSNPMYSVSIRITDYDTLKQAVDLALKAYDLT